MKKSAALILLALTACSHKAPPALSFRTVDEVTGQPLAGVNIIQHDYSNSFSGSESHQVTFSTDGTGYATSAPLKYSEHEWRFSKSGYADTIVNGDQTWVSITLDPETSGGPGFVKDTVPGMEIPMKPAKAAY